jgi:hypothetical protein
MFVDKQKKGVAAGCCSDDKHLTIHSNACGMSQMGRFLSTVLSFLT